MINNTRRQLSELPLAALLSLAIVARAALPTNGTATTNAQLAGTTNTPNAAPTPATNVSRSSNRSWPRAFANLNYAAVDKPECSGNPRREVKAIYVNLYSACSGKLNDLIELAGQTDINAFVIDVKDDRGNLLFRNMAAAKLNAEANRKALMDDARPLLQRLKAKQIYCIARIVTFKDPLFARNHPQKAIINNRTEQPFQGSDGLTWASPYDADFREYDLGIAYAAAVAGFNEIQFDYIRFPDVARNANLNYRSPGSQSKAQAVQSFLLEARRRLRPLNVYVAADVFGLVCTTADDMDIGQYWEAVSNAVDYICPMMYPSHYANRSYGLRVPDQQPYELIDRGIKDALRRNRNLATPARLRPWIQAFTATWLKEYHQYDVAAVKAQIKALSDNGVQSYLIWNPANNYQKQAYR